MRRARMVRLAYNEPNVPERMLPADAGGVAAKRSWNLSFGRDSMPQLATRRIAVLGAGPIGLEAGLYARQLKLPFTIFEQGRIGEHVWRWGHVRLFSPFGMNSTPLGRKAIFSLD